MRISTKCSVAVHCLLFLQEYGEAGKVTSGQLSMSTGCNPVVIRGIMSALKKAGLIEVRPGVGGARLRLPPGEITLERICAAVEPGYLEGLMGVHPAPSKLCPVGRSIHAVLDQTYGRVLEDLRESLGSITLEEIGEAYAGERARAENS